MKEYPVFVDTSNDCWQIEGKGPFDMAHDPYSAVPLVEDLIGAREGKTNELLHSLTREDTESEVMVDEIVGRIKSIELLIRWLQAEQSTLTTALEMRELRDQPLADTLAQLKGE